MVLMISSSKTSLIATTADRMTKSLATNGTQEILMSWRSNEMVTTELAAGARHVFEGFADKWPGNLVYFLLFTHFDSILQMFSLSVLLLHWLRAI